MECLWKNSLNFHTIIWTAVSLTSVKGKGQHEATEDIGGWRQWPLMSLSHITPTLLSVQQSPLTWCVKFPKTNQKKKESGEQDSKAWDCLLLKASIVAVEETGAGVQSALGNASRCTFVWKTPDCRFVTQRSKDFACHGNPAGCQPSELSNGNLGKSSSNTLWLPSLKTGPTCVA